MNVPEDFPPLPPTAVSGFQPKIALSEIDGRYYVGESAQERYERWLECEELAKLIAADCELLPRDQRGQRLMNHYEAGLSTLGAAVMRWICTRIAERLDVEFPGGDPQQPKSIEVDSQIAKAFIERMDATPKIQSSLKTRIEEILRKST